MIDRSSPVPLYYQLKQILLSKIQDNQWTSGEVIPSEQELQDTYGLSRTTVRQTLADLVTEGFLVRERGRGTFISKPKVTYNPSTAIELNEYIRQQGVPLGWRMISTEWEKASLHVAAALKLPPEASVFAIKRLRLAGTEPLGYHFAYISKDLASSIIKDNLTQGDSLDYLQNVAAMKNHRTERTLEAGLASDLECSLLGLRAGDAVLFMERFVSSEEGTPLEYLRAGFSGSRFKYRISF